MNKTFYITTSIAYTNAAPHIGYALELVQADVLARYYKQSGVDTYFLTGTDDHGVKIERSAKDAKLSPEKFVAKNITAFKELVKKLNISSDDFISTSDRKRHWPGAIALWKKLDASGDIYKKKYKGLYCVGCEAFKKETDLVDGKCSDHKKAPEMVEEENYFFKLSKYTQQIKQMIEKDILQIIPETRKNETLNMIKDIGDVSFSRPKEKLSWGIPVPGDSSQTMYVWCDALTNYISALGYGKTNVHPRGVHWFEKYWPAQVHCIGKDILKFHTIFWPAMLLSAKLPLPKTIFVHGHITSEGQKMSKSLGNVVDPLKLIEKYGVDAVRYYLLREISPTGDGDFSQQRFEEIYNTELANELGNLTNRVIKMITRYNVKIQISNIKLSPNDQKLNKLIENFEFGEALKEIWKQIRQANQYIETQKPWELAKNDRNELKRVIQKLVKMLYVTCYKLRVFLPETSKKIQTQLKTLKPEPLFPRLH